MSGFGGQDGGGHDGEVGSDITDGHGIVFGVTK